VLAWATCIGRDSAKDTKTDLKIFIDIVFSQAEHYQQIKKKQLFSYSAYWDYFI
jgi:hypothetical protein